MIESRKILILFTAVLIFCSIALWMGINYYKNKKITRLYRCIPSLKIDLQEVTSQENGRIVLFGDSRIGDWKAPDFGTKTAIINIGIGGATTGEALCLVEDIITKLKPEWFVIQLGINDLVAASMMKDELRLKIEERTFYNLKLITKKITSASIHVIILTIVPPISPGILRSLIWGEGIQESAERLSNALMKELPDNITVYDMKKIFFNSKSNIWDKDFSEDALHWNKKAYHRLNREIEQLIPQ